jgi:hypothetical protein
MPFKEDPMTTAELTREVVELGGYQFHTKPYDHQAKVFMDSRRKPWHALFMEQGTGKSKVVVDTAAWLFEQDEIDAVLVIGPKGSYDEWRTTHFPVHLPPRVPARMAVWSSYTTSDVLKSFESLFKPQQTKELKVFVVNLEALSHAEGKGMQAVLRFLKAYPRCLGVVDESSQVRNRTAQRTKNVLKLRPLLKYRRILTGTPISQSPLDLFTQCLFLHETAPGTKSFTIFRLEHAIIERKHYGPRSFDVITGYQNLDRLRARVATFSHIIRKEDCLDLPPKVFMTRHVPLHADQSAIYRQLRDEALVILEGAPAVTAPLVLTQLLRLHQVACGHLVLDDGTVKSLPNYRLQELDEVLDEASGQVIIWANYRHDLAAIYSRLVAQHGEQAVAAYWGATSEEDRIRGLEDFRAGKARYFVGNPSTGGYGLNLVQASTVIYYSNSFNLEHRLQSEDRAHRIGQTKTVTYVDLVTPRTVDEKIVQALVRKNKLALGTMGGEWRGWIEA